MYWSSSVGRACAQHERRYRGRDARPPKKEWTLRSLTPLCKANVCIPATTLPLITALSAHFLPTIVFRKMCFLKKGTLFVGLGEQ